MNEMSLQFRLSADELRLILNLLEADTLPGLTPSQWSVAEQAVAFSVAEQSLQARGMVQSTDQGLRQVQREVLTTIATCAYSQQAIIVTYWPDNQLSPRRYFGHQLDGRTVVHTEPQVGVHQFVSLEASESLVSHMLDFCQCDAWPLTDSVSFSLPSAAFGQVRQLVDSHQPAEAVSHLQAHAPSSGASQRFIATLTANPRLTIARTIRQTEGAVLHRDFVILQAEPDTWLLVSENGQAEPNLLVSLTHRAELEPLLASWWST